jgi:hypothetical protein
MDFREAGRLKEDEKFPSFQKTKKLILRYDFTHIF